MNLKGLLPNKSYKQLEGGQLCRKTEQIPIAGDNKHGGTDGGKIVGLDHL